MAKPDCDDGWLRYAHELDAALAIADFNKAERIVLSEMFAQIFGPAKLSVANLSPSDIGRRIGKSHTYISRAINTLTKGLVIARLPGGGYRFLKDYESWLSGDGTKRLSKAEVSYIASAPARAMSYKRKTLKSAVSNEIHDLASDVSNEIPNLYPTGYTNGIQRDTPRACASENSEFKTFKTGEEENARANSREDSYLEPFTADNPDLPPEITGPGKNSPEAIALGKWAEQWGTDPLGCSYAFWAREQCAFNPVAWVRLLIERRVCGNPKRPKIQFLTKDLAEWRTAGEPGYALPQPQANGHAGLPPIARSPSLERAWRVQQSFDNVDWSEPEYDEYGREIPRPPKLKAATNGES